MKSNWRSRLPNFAGGAQGRASVAAKKKTAEQEDNPPRRLFWLVPSILLGAVAWVMIVTWIFR